MMIRFIPIGSRPPRKLLWRLSRAKPVLASPGDVLKPVVALARLAADAGKSAPRRFILGAQVDGAAVGAGRPGLVAEALIGEPSGGPGLGILRVGLNRFVEIGGRFFGLVELEIAQRAGHQRLSLLRHQAARRGKS